MKISETQKFELSLIALSLVAAFAWTAYLGEYLPAFKVEEEPKVLGLTTENLTPKYEESTHPEAYFQCTYDSDCVAVQRDCCGCEDGGEMIAVNKEMRNEYLRDTECTDQACSGENSCIPRKPICDLGMCYLMVPTSKVASIGDLDLNARIDAYDYSILLKELRDCESGSCTTFDSDINEDGVVSIHDYYEFIEQLEK